MLKFKRLAVIITAYILTAVFIIMTVDVVKNPTNYDTVAKYHATLAENRE